jgi:adenylate kinase family enzyme
MQRVFVTGNAGSGKTSLATTLAAQLGLPYTGLDSIVWESGWVKTPRLARLEKELALAAKLAWVVDGVSDVMLHAADTVVFLDYPRRKCFWRVMWRNLPYLFRSRPGLPSRCPEVLIISRLIKLIWCFPAHVRPKLLEASGDKLKSIIHIRTNEELRQFMSSIRMPGSNFNRGGRDIGGVAADARR